MTGDNLTWMILTALMDDVEGPDELRFQPEVEQPPKKRTHRPGIGYRLLPGRGCHSDRDLKCTLAEAYGKL